MDTKITSENPYGCGRHGFAWEKIPQELKFAQALYKKYLNKYNYRGVFKDFSPTIWRWPGSAIAIVPIARAVKFMFGEQTKDIVYKYAGYFGHYRNHYACYGLKYFLENIGDTRGEISFSVKTWFQENGIPFTM